MVAFVDEIFVALDCSAFGLGLSTRMKRKIMLVSYDSSDGEAEGMKAREPEVKRKLPRVSPSLVLPTPESEPERHQGRVRTTQHVDGQFAAFVYIPVPMNNEAASAKLREILERAVRAAKDVVPHLISDWLLEGGKHELHISLSRPIYLRDHQREELKRAVKAAARGHNPFVASLSAFAAFDNDERTRGFLGVEVGAGHADLKSLSDSLVPTLKLLHQKVFYSEPRFHASIAWALPHDRKRSEECPPSMTPLDGEAEASSNTHVTTSPYLSSLVPDLNDQFGPQLAKGGAGTFEVRTIQVKIGKDVHSWKLGTSS